MQGIFMDLNTGNFCEALDDQMAMDINGHGLAKISDDLALDLENGELHAIDSWPAEEEEDEDEW